MAEEKKPALGLSTGVGLVIANMIGVGVLTSNGYMAQKLSPTLIFLIWSIQGVLAIAGARAYAAIAQIIPRSGGEYRYLSDLLHPALGYLAGWTSLLVGFAAPVAANAFAVGGFSRTIAPGLDARVVGAAVIVVVTVFQAMNLRTARWSQDVLAWVKAVLFLGFVLVGLIVGSKSVPAAQPAGGFPRDAFVLNLFFAAYAYSGWNATIYAAEEFKDPKRDVARSMMIGAALVTVAYLAITWVFVANLSPGTDMKVWDKDAMTVAHIIAQKLLGKGAAVAVSIGVILVLLSCVSAMMLIGPRVNATMARDGFLPRMLAGKEGRPPVVSVILQGALALALLFTNKFEVLATNVGVILTLMSALTVLGLFRVALFKTPYARPGLVAMLAATLYVGASAWMLWYAFNLSESVKWWVLGTGAVSLVAYGATRQLAARRAAAIDPSR